MFLKIKHLFTDLNVLYIKHLEISILFKEEEYLLSERDNYSDMGISLRYWGRVTYC